MTRRTRRNVFVVATLLVGGTMAGEVRHRFKYGHWISYGWHVDVVSAPAPLSFRGVSKTVQFATIRNFTLLPASIQFCVAVDDVAPYELPFAAFRIEASGDGRTWRTLAPQDGLECGERRRFEGTIRPLESFGSLRGAWGGMDGTRKGNWIRFIVYSSFDQRSNIRREFGSPPFQLTEDRKW